MKLGLILCAFGLHRWEHFDRHNFTVLRGRQIPMTQSQRQCERCRLLQNYNRLRTFVGASEWEDVRFIPCNEGRK